MLFKATVYFVYENDSISAAGYTIMTVYSNNDII